MVLNYAGRELVLRVTWIGAPHAGKATCLRYIHTSHGVRRERGIPARIRPAYHLYFHFMPRVAPFGRWDVRLELQTLTGDVDASAWAPAFDGVDGVVFVADSDPARASENRAARDLVQRELPAVPRVFLFNKRDLADAVSVADLSAQLDVRDAPCIEAVATEGRGVPDALDALLSALRATLKDV